MNNWIFVTPFEFLAIGMRSVCFNLLLTFIGVKNEIYLVDILKLLEEISLWRRVRKAQNDAVNFNTKIFQI